MNNPAARSMHAGTLEKLRLLLGGDGGTPGSLRQLCIEQLRIQHLEDESEVLDKLPVVDPTWPVRPHQGASAETIDAILNHLEAPSPIDEEEAVDRWDLYHYRARFSRMYLSEAFRRETAEKPRKTSNLWTPDPHYVVRFQVLISMALPFVQQPSSWRGPPFRFALFILSTLRGTDDAVRARWPAEHRRILEDSRRLSEGIGLLLEDFPPEWSAGPGIDPFQKDLRSSLAQLKKNLKEAFDRL
jgi:hypothetical protein